MAWARVTSGTQTAVIGTEHTLYTSVSGDNGKTVLLLIDTTNMANADVVEFRIKRKVVAPGSATLIYLATYAHVQLEFVKISIPIPVIDTGALFTLKQTEGTGRAFDWSIESQ